MDSTSATMINSQVRHHGLPIYKQSGFILMMDALGTKEITERMDPSNYYIKWESVITFIENTIKLAKSKVIFVTYILFRTHYLLFSI